MREMMPTLSTNTVMTSPRPEIELLLCCARTYLDSEIAERIRALCQKDIDWSYLIQTAYRHGVMPLLYQNLSTVCPETVPQATLAELRDYFQTNARRNILLAKKLLKLLDLFETHGIPALPLKGPVLAASIYGDLSLRQFGDLDVLIRKRDVPKARELLVSQGYQPRRHSQQTRAQETASFQVRHHCQFVRDDSKVLVELHWAILERQFSFPLDLVRLWERLVPVSLAGTNVRNFSPEDLLLTLCVHGSKPSHRWGRLNWVCDVAELIRLHQGLAWEQVIAQARRLGSERRLWLGLLLAKELLGATLPEVVRQKIKADPVVKSLATKVHERLFGKIDGSPGDFVEFSLHFRMVERWQDRIRSCLYFALDSFFIKWALRSPVGLLSFPYRMLDRGQCKNVWIWPLPLFAILSFLYHLLLPIRQIVRYGLKQLKRPDLSGFSSGHT
jgi:hypothetical protein